MVRKSARERRSRVRFVVTWDSLDKVVYNRTNKGMKTWFYSARYGSYKLYSTESTLSRMKWH